MAPLLGSAVGLDSEQRSLFARDKACSHDALFQALLHPLLPAQAAFLLLRLSAHPRFLFLCRTLPPALSLPACSVFDERVLVCQTPSLMRL